MTSIVMYDCTYIPGAVRSDEQHNYLSVWFLVTLIMSNVQAPYIYMVIHWYTYAFIHTYTCTDNASMYSIHKQWFGDTLYWTFIQPWNKIVFNNSCATGNTSVCGWRLERATYITVLIVQRIYLHDFLVILKWSLQHYKKIAKTCILISDSSIWMLS